MNRYVVLVAVPGLLALGQAPNASAQIPCSGTALYCNGTTYGNQYQSDGYPISSSGYYVSNSFVLSGSSTVTGADFIAWLETQNQPDDAGFSLSTVGWFISSAPLAGGTVYGSGTANVNNTYEYQGYDDQNSVFLESFSIPSLNLAAGTYYLTLDNAVVTTPSDAFADNAAWWVTSNDGGETNNDDGPSSAYASYYVSSSNPADPSGNIATYWANYDGGRYACGTTCSEGFEVDGTAQAPLTPEPTSMALLGAGTVCLGVIRRRMSR